MALSIEYNRKINCFIENLPKRMYHACQDVAFEGFITREKLTLKEALMHEKTEFPTGTKWGKNGNTVGFLLK